MNKANLIGRVVRDPDIRVGNEKTIAHYTLAVDRKYGKKGEKEADFISCVAFGKGAEFAEKYLRKGMKIAVSGRIQTGSYQNKDGQTVYTTDVVVEEQEFCESKLSEQAQAEEKTAKEQRRYAEEPIPTRRDVPDNIDPEWASIPDGIDESELPFGG